MIMISVGAALAVIGLVGMGYLMGRIDREDL